MTRLNVRAICAVATAIAMGGFSATASAQGATDFIQAMKPYVSAKYQYDSNVFRLPDKSTADRLYGKRQLDDTFYTIEAGLDGEINWSRQNLVLQGFVFQNYYDEFSDNDYIGAEANVIWNWQTGEKLTGDLGYIYDREQRDYANQATAAALANPPASISDVNNIRERNSLIGSLRYLVGDSYSVYTKGKVTDISFSDENAFGESLDLERSAVNVGIDYDAENGNRVGFDGQWVQGNYDDLTTQDYDEFTFSPTANWEISEKTRLRGKAGYTTRDYDDARQQDYDGITGRLTLVRNPQEPTTIESSIYREISTLNDDISNYAVIDGWNIMPTIALGGKSSLRLLAEFQNRDFKGSATNNPTNRANREDNVATAEIAYDWAFSRIASLTATLTYENRNSNLNTEDYEYVWASISISGGFGSKSPNRQNGY